MSHSGWNMRLYKSPLAPHQRVQRDLKTAVDLDQQSIHYGCRSRSALLPVGAVKVPLTMYRWYLVVLLIWSVAAVAVQRLDDINTQLQIQVTPGFGALINRNFQFRATNVEGVTGNNEKSLRALYHKAWALTLKKKTRILRFGPLTTRDRDPFEPILKVVSEAVETDRGSFALTVVPHGPRRPHLYWGQVTAVLDHMIQLSSQGSTDERTANILFHGEIRSSEGLYDAPHRIYVEFAPTR